MLITFTTKAAPDITMFGDVAAALLKLMGQSGVVPGALLAADVPGALEHLRKAIAAVGSEPSASPGEAHREAKDEDAPPPVSLRQRAYPLIGLLEAAVREQSDVMWAPTSNPLL